MVFFQRIKVQFKRYKILYIKNRTLFNNIFRFITAFIVGFILSVLFSDIKLIVNYIKTTSIPHYITGSIINTTNFLLNLLGFDTYVQNNFLQIKNNTGFRFIYSCLGIRQMMFFAGFILSYYGKLLNKIWYVLVGFIILNFLNSFRATVIYIINFYHPEYTDFAHYYLTRIVMYVSIFLLWMIWIRFFATKKIKPTD